MGSGTPERGGGCRRGPSVSSGVRHARNFVDTSREMAMYASICDQFTAVAWAKEVRRCRGCHGGTQKSGWSKPTYIRCGLVAPVSGQDEGNRGSTRKDNHPSCRSRVSPDSRLCFQGAEDCTDDRAGGEPAPQHALQKDLGAQGVWPVDHRQLLDQT